MRKLLHQITEISGFTIYSADSHTVGLREVRRIQWIFQNYIRIKIE